MRPPTATPLARLKSRLGNDRGGVLETVIIWPVVLLLFFGAVQGALYFHARNVAMKAGEEGLRKHEHNSAHQQQEQPPPTDSSHRPAPQSYGAPPSQ